MGSAIAPARHEDAMLRIRGTHLLAASIVLWALAVWVFGTPHPAANEATTTDTAPATSVETTQGTGTAAGESAAAAPAAPALASASREPVVAAAPDTGTDTASSPVETPAVPAAGVPAAATGDRSSGTPATDAGSVAARPITPGTSTAEGAGDDRGAGDSPLASAPALPRFESAPSHLPPPPGYPALDDGAVSGQLDAARRAAWEGRFADAVAHYRAAARLRPDDHVVWGEMGNVLWTMRRWPEAAYALEGAATLLVRAGELRAASELVPAVGRIDRQAAYRIERLLWEAAQRQPG